jgi:VNT family MFS transporter (synaptic vesicle glycoprotein 2)
LITPLNGILFLNQDTWGFRIPLIDLNYNAWRIFMVMCSVPSVICAVLMIIFIPESPKFTYAQGDEIRTLNILKRIYTSNTGRDDYKVTSLIKDKEFEDASNPRNCSFLEFMWSQTVPIFKHPHLKNTLTACFLQFSLCFIGNGFWTFFPEIVNKVTIFLDSNPDHTTSTICEIVSISNSTSAAVDGIPTTCVTKLEIGTFYNVAMLSILYSIGWLIISIVINRAGKLIVLLFVMTMCGTASILLMFIEIPQVSLYIYLVMLLSGLNMSVVNTSTVELFPTTLRAMVVSISMMTGRIGSVIGSNFVGLLIKNYCTYTFIMPAVLMVSGGILSFTIPNINKRVKK